MRVGTTHPLPVRRFQEAGQARILEMRIEEAESFLGQPQRIPVADVVGMRQRQKHT